MSVKSVMNEIKIGLAHDNMLRKKAIKRIVAEVKKNGVTHGELELMKDLFGQTNTASRYEKVPPPYREAPPCTTFGDVGKPFLSIEAAPVLRAAMLMLGIPEHELSDVKISRSWKGPFIVK